ncbi:MAG: glycosyltransferase family 4 protein [Candidatus Moranbacteria bacterium]|nr:glycosyltransferase family 4 protein [Candidatus Moranbacteria bacterium]
MKIGIDASFLRKPGNGIGQVTEQTLRALALLPESTKHQFVLYLEEYSDTSSLPGNFRKHVFLPSWKRDDIPRRYLWERMLATKAAEDGCNAFISLSQSATVFPYTIPRSEGIRHLMVVHDIVPILFPAYRRKFTSRLHLGAIMTAIGKAERILAVSNTTKRDLELNLGIPSERISVAYPDCSNRFREPIPENDASRVLGKYDLTSGYIYHGGGLEIRKNTERLLRAYAEILTDRNGDVPPLVISGKIHDRRNRMATDVVGIIRKLKIQDHVKLLGFVPDEDLPALYKEALFFVFPSLYEGFGIPILEAFAEGTPVLAGRTAGAVPEVTGHAALLVETQDISAIRVGLERLMDDASFRDTLMERGTERVKDFSWEKFAQSLLDETLKNDDPKDAVLPETSST